MSWRGSARRGEKRASDRGLLTQSQQNSIDGKLKIEEKKRLGPGEGEEARVKKRGTGRQVRNVTNPNSRQKGCRNKPRNGEGNDRKGGGHRVHRSREDKRTISCLTQTGLVEQDQEEGNTEKWVKV